MPHRINTDDIKENLFILRNLSIASRSFCEKYKTNRFSGEESECGWDYYVGWLKPIVSEKLIDCAIKARIVLDFCPEEDEEIDISALDQKACRGIVLGKFHVGSCPLTLREIFNKIIHATEVSLVWEDLTSEDLAVKASSENSPEYWKGSVMLCGSKRGEKWELELYVTEFCTALEKLIGELENNVDFHDIYDDE